MTRLLFALRLDMRIQFRNGFYYVGAFVVVVAVVLLGLLRGPLDLSLIIPGLVFFNLLITTFYFVGGLVLLEKEEGSLVGLAVTPLRKSEYLLAKIGSLTLLAGIETTLYIVIAFGVMPPFFGMILLAGIYTLFGFVAIARYDSINEFLLPSVIVVMLLMLPLVGFFELWHSPIFYLHPLQPTLVLMRAAYAPATPAEIAYGVLGSLFWYGVLFAWARRAFDRVIMEKGS
ncbi:MAG: ABC transporter permease [Anaerolineae bacterium]|nr:ABC transporter permease [Anaerolineae bacterium]